MEDVDELYIAFKAGALTLAFPMEAILGVTDAQGLVPFPGVEPWANSLVEYREELLPVFDLALRLQGTACTGGCLALLQLEDKPLGLKIDEPGYNLSISREILSTAEKAAAGKYDKLLIAGKEFILPTGKAFER